MPDLRGKIAIVAGGSRGAGRGIALALGDAGATVYVAARTSRTTSRPADAVPGTAEDTAEEVTRRGGKGIPVVADMGDENQAADLFHRVEKDHQRLDVLANSAWSANYMPMWSKKFWELDSGLWRETLNTVSVAWLTSVHAMRLMSKQRAGLIVHVTDNLHPDPSGHRGQILHDMGHECLNRLVMSMSMQTKKFNVAIAGLNPGFMQTEAVLMHMTTAERMRQHRFDLSESVEYIGRAVAALVADNDVMRKNGELLWVCDVAKEYGFTDIDGRYIPRFDPKAPVQEYPCLTRMKKAAM